MFGWLATRAPALRAESAPAVGIEREGIRQDLDRDVAIELRVARAIDLAHAARADRRDDFVRAETSAGNKGHEAPAESIVGYTLYVSEPPPAEVLEKRRMQSERLNKRRKRRNGDGTEERFDGSACRGRPTSAGRPDRGAETNISSQWKDVHSTIRSVALRRFATPVESLLTSGRPPLLRFSVVIPFAL